MSRLTYEDSISELIKRGFLGADERPVLSHGMPSPLDDNPQLSFFRTQVEGDLSGLSIPRTLFCRSEIINGSFRNTDLSESFLCWNDFTDIDFSSAVLRGCDLRGSTYLRVRFSGADLSGADLRRTDFTDCDFTGALLAGAKVQRSLWGGLNLSPEQQEKIEWTLLPGDEPPGG